MPPELCDGILEVLDFRALGLRDVTLVQRVLQLPSQVPELRGRENRVTPNARFQFRLIQRATCTRNGTRLLETAEGRPVSGHNQTRVVRPSSV